MVGILSSPNMQKLLANASLDLDSEKQTELEEIYESPVRGAQLRLLSAVNLVFLSNTNTDKLNSKVTFAFSHPVSPWVGRGDQPYCSPHGQGHRGPSAAFVSPPPPTLLLPYRYLRAFALAVPAAWDTFPPHDSVLYLSPVFVQMSPSFLGLP